jgi:hypothetical protein
MRRKNDSNGEAAAARRPAAPLWAGPTRAVLTLLGVAAAGLLAWLTTTVGHGSNAGYWAAYGLLAAAGLVLALSQLLGGWTKWGRPRLSLPVFLLAFLPALVAAAWVLALHQPQANWFRGHAFSWSADLGIGGLVESLGGVLGVLAFGLGLVFGLSFDTTGPARVAEAPAAAPATEAPLSEPADDFDYAAADEPLTRDREVVRAG